MSNPTRMSVQLQGATRKRQISNSVRLPHHLVISHETALSIDKIRIPLLINKTSFFHSFTYITRSIIFNHSQRKTFSFNNFAFRIVICSSHLISPSTWETSPGMDLGILNHFKSKLSGIQRNRHALHFSIE